MKIKAIAAIAALAFAPGLAQAFTIDFASSIGAVIPPSLVVNVPGYGDVSFTSGYNAILGADSQLTVGTDFYGAPSLQFIEGDTIIVTFLGAVPSHVDFNTIAVSVGTGEGFSKIDAGHVYLLTLNNSIDGAGVIAVNFDAVPEPGAAVLGLIGVTGMLLRRRR